MSHFARIAALASAASFASFASFAPFAILAAQLPVAGAPTPLPAESRIRVTASALGAAPVVGSVLRMDGDSLRFVEASTDSVRAILLSQVTRLEKTSGRRGHTLKGMGIGLLSGVVVGAVVGYASYTPCTQTGFMACFMAPKSAADAAGMGAVGFGLAGTLVGTIVGALVRTDRWVDVSREPAMRVTVGPSPRGAMLGMSVRF